MNALLMFDWSIVINLNMHLPLLIEEKLWYKFSIHDLCDLRDFPSIRCVS